MCGSSVCGVGVTDYETWFLRRRKGLLWGGTATQAWSSHLSVNAPLHLDWLDARLARGDEVIEIREGQSGTRHHAVKGTQRSSSSSIPPLDAKSRRREAETGHGIGATRGKEKSLCRMDAWWRAGCAATRNPWLAVEAATCTMWPFRGDPPPPQDHEQQHEQLNTHATCYGSAAVWCAKCITCTQLQLANCMRDVD